MAETWPVLSVGAERENFRQFLLADPTVRSETLDGRPLARSGVQPLLYGFSFSLRHLSVVDKELLEALQEATLVGGEIIEWEDERPTSDSVPPTHTVRLATSMEFDLDDDAARYRTEVLFHEEPEADDFAPETLLYGGDMVIEVENLAAGADILNRPIYSPGSGITLTVVKILTKGTPTGIDNSNTVVLALKDNGGNTILTKTYNTASQPPTLGLVDLSSLIVSAYATVLSSEFLTLSMTQGATANMPAFALILGGTLL
jgi:hypothetical protein